MTKRTFYAGDRVVVTASKETLVAAGLPKELHKATGTVLWHSLNEFSKTIGIKLDKEIYEKEIPKGHKVAWFLYPTMLKVLPTDGKTVEGANVNKSLEQRITELETQMRSVLGEKYDV